MRISDWSSDVCSSDLIGPAVAVEGQGFVLQQRLVAHHAVCAQAAQALGQPAVVGGDGAAFSHGDGLHRMEGERRHDGKAAVADRPEVAGRRPIRSEEHTSELQSLMRLSYAVFCLKK